MSVLLDEADEGGLFRYAPNIRSRTDEKADIPAAVMLGDDGPVKTLELRPGDMQIFQGRYSLHEVTRVGPQSKPRHTAVFAYTLEEGLIGGLVRTEQLFGRTLPIITSTPPARRSARTRCWTDPHPVEVRHPPQFVALGVCRS